MKLTVKSSLILAFLAELFLVFIIYFNPYRIEPLYDPALMSWGSATFNSLAALSLMVAILLIRKKRVRAHIIWIHITLLFSSCFLINYIFYHLSVGHVTFNNQTLRPYYLILLITHLTSSFISLPLIFATYTLAMTKRIEEHKKIAKFTFSLWMYVSVTGVIVVLFLKLFNQ